MNRLEKLFIVDESVIDIGLKGIYLTVSNIENKTFDDGFLEYQKKVLANAYTYCSETDIKTDPIISGFRQLHEKVGAPNRKNLSAPENLYKLLKKNGGHIPHVNLLVDIYNTISLKYKLALGAHDMHEIEGNIHLKFTTGNEKFDPIGEMEKPFLRNVYSYIDDSDEILCYLDVRQVKKTAVKETTNSVFFIVQGNGCTPIAYIEKAVDELIALVKKYCGGQEQIIGIVE